MLVYFSIILVAMLGFCGLAVDTARMELRTNQLQAAADIGALAAAGELWHWGTGANYKTAANNDVAAYEAANNIPSTGTPATQIGATYGPYLGDFSTVQVTVTQSFPTIFLGLLSSGNAATTLTATAVAQVPPCMMFFGTPNVLSTQAFKASTAKVDTVNYECPFYTKTGAVIDAFSRYGSSQVRSSAPASSSDITGATVAPPLYNVPVLTDPLAYVTAPMSGNCINALPISDLSLATAVTINLTPGTYCGTTLPVALYVPAPSPSCLGIAASKTVPAFDVGGTFVGCPNQSQTNGGNCLTTPTLNFAPGLYIIIGGFNLNCVNVTGTGVTLYLTKSSTVGYGVARFTSSSWGVSAPVDNSLNGIPGIAVMTDRAWVGGSEDLSWTYSTWNADGVIYSMATGVNGYALRMSAPSYLNIIAANMFTYDVSVRPTVNYSSLPAGNPLRTVISLVQ